MMSPRTTRSLILPQSLSLLFILSIAPHGTHGSINSASVSDFRLALSEEDEGELSQSCQQIHGLGIIVNLTFHPSAKAFTAAN